MKTVYSVVVPVHNEAANLSELVRRMTAVLDALGEAWELVIVDDGSTDESTRIIREVAQQDRRVRPVILARSFGHQIAITAGWDFARGDAVIVADGDLQDPPEVIPELVRKWKEGYEVVYGVRRERRGETWFKKSTATLFYRLLRRLTEVPIPADVGDFRLMDRRVVDVLKRMKEHHRFPRGMSAWVGFRQAAVAYTRDARARGESKYRFRRMARLATTAITGFSSAPLRLATLLGFLSTGAALVCAPFVLVARASHPASFLAAFAGWIPIFFLGGIQLICIGILGEYIGRLYDEARGRPLYVVREAPED